MAAHGVDPKTGRPLREPCPERIYADCGGAFAMGCVGGTIFHGLKGFKNSPPGFSRRMYGSMMAVRSKSLVLGGFSSLSPILSYHILSYPILPSPILSSPPLPSSSLLSFLSLACHLPFPCFPLPSTNLLFFFPCFSFSF